MKKVLIALVALFTTFTANAQIVDGLQYPKAHFGIRAAFTSNTVTYEYRGVENTSDALPFVAGGLAVDFKIASLPIYLESGLYYMNKGGKYDYGYGEEKQDNSCIIMPILASYHLYFTDNLAIQPFAGPYVGYGIDQEKFESGIRVGCGFNFGRLYANVGYDFGFKTDDLKNNTLFATIGFNFMGDY